MAVTEAGLVHGYLRARATVPRAARSFARITTALSDLSPQHLARRRRPRMNAPIPTIIPNLTHWQERCDMAAAFRWTARLNMHEAVANHFSLAVNDSGHPVP